MLDSPPEQYSNVLLVSHHATFLTLSAFLLAALQPLLLPSWVQILSSLLLLLLASIVILCWGP